VDKQALVGALEQAIPPELAEDLASEFISIRQDVATRTLGRATPGKFVESVVQALQALEQGGQYDKQPDVDRYLRGLESRSSTLPDGLRICAARFGRAMYSLRSKRSIVHKGAIDPSEYDLRLLYASAQWIIAELIALTDGISAADAGRLVEQVPVPVDGLVEVVQGRKLVQGNVTVREEVLILLMSSYPDLIPRADVTTAMDRRSPSSVSNALGALWKDKLLHRSSDGQVVLTDRGMREAIGVAQNHLD